ncbi:MAG: hypothetical protein MZW92_41415 [Comamonadaceae bacterium]|nr:hypothetical protein [Comamonadaceae bacterium]
MADPEDTGRDHEDPPAVDDLKVTDAEEGPPEVVPRIVEIEERGGGDGSSLWAKVDRDGDGLGEADVQLGKTSTGTYYGDINEDGYSENVANDMDGDGRIDTVDTTGQGSSADTVGADQVVDPADDHLVDHGTADDEDDGDGLSSGADYDAADSSSSSSSSSSSDADEPSGSESDDTGSSSSGTPTADLEREQALGLLAEPRVGQRLPDRRAPVEQELAGPQRGDDRELESHPVLRPMRAQELGHARLDRRDDQDGIDEDRWTALRARKPFLATAAS